jgi:hypothetical protein
MNFFKNFPVVEVDLQRDGKVNKMVNIFRSVRPLQNFIDDSALYTFYEIKNGERPDIVSQRLYKTPEFYWTFFVINERLHDGYRAWPMSQEILEKYLEVEYEGFALVTHPEVDTNSDGSVVEYTNSLAGENITYTVDGTRYRLGETVTGSSSNATGKVTKKNLDLNQLIVQSVSGTFESGEFVDGATSQASVQVAEVFKYAEAPHHYYKKGDTEERPVTPRKFINSQLATSDADLDFTTNREYINELNEERSFIRVIQPEYISQFVEQFENTLNDTI